MPGTGLFSDRELAVLKWRETKYKVIEELIAVATDVSPERRAAEPRHS